MGRRLIPSAYRHTQSSRIWPPESVEDRLVIQSFVILPHGHQEQLQGPELIVLQLIYPLLEYLVAGTTENNREALLVGSGGWPLAVQRSFLGHFNQLHFHCHRWREMDS